MLKSEQGCVYWITGLSGAGKSTVSYLFFKRLKKMKENVILLDGDKLRSALGVEANYTYEERKKLALTYCRLCKMLVEQGCDVIIATVSMFHECHRWNRENQPHYYEVYLRVPLKVLAERDQKNLFSNAIKHVVGVDIPFEEPIDPDLIIENYGDISPEMAEEELYQCIINKQSGKEISLF